MTVPCWYDSPNCFWKLGSIPSNRQGGRNCCLVANNLVSLTNPWFPHCLHFEIVCTGAPFDSISALIMIYSPTTSYPDHFVFALACWAVVYDWGVWARHFKNSEWTNMSVSHTFNVINNEPNLYFFEKWHFKPTENTKLNEEMSIIRHIKSIAKAKLSKGIYDNLWFFYPMLLP